MSDMEFWFTVILCGGAGFFLGYFSGARTAYKKTKKLILDMKDTR